MDPATTLALIQTILAAIQSLAQLQSLFSISHCRSELDDLHNTVETVRAVLEDADARQDSLNAQEKHYIQELKDAVYDADDVLDEFLTLAKQNQLRRNKVTSFLSHQFKILTHRISSKVKMVNNKLNTIATKSTMYSFKVDYKPIKFTKEETSSCLSDVIIGREDDVEKIVGVLLGSHNVDQPNVSLLAIMGMGGLGKTALAQLVYNDPRITEAFPLKRWTCIADQDQQQLDLKGHLAKVVKGFSVSDKTSLEDIHNEDKQQLGGKKYLLVLDDVWTESYDQWQKFKGFLNVGGRGSWIIVTTRSKTTAQMIGTDGVHEVQGLTEPESWHLFERMAFQGVERDDELVKLGKKIVKKCTNVPLAIRVVGSLLRGQSLSKWLSFHDKGLDCLSESNDAMMTRILKLSYDQLNPPLRTCFAYCAIFPKDQRISKKMLIQLWMAQGYINSEDLGEEYFLILLHRCFFQDIDEDEFGGIKSFKIHDLLHDIAEKVAGEEIFRFSFDTSSVGKRVRHLSLMHNSYAQHTFNNSHIRTCLFIRGFYKGRVDQLLASKSIRKWTCLRSLDLSESDAKSLPKSIGDLLHLRSLDLSYNRHLEVLPKSIIKLVNLQTFNLHSCKSLKQLPDDVSKLVNLSTLNVAECDALSHMPAGISMLSSLQTLCQFVVGERAGSDSKQCFDGLEDLKHLNKLKGELTIEIAVLENAKFVKEEQGGGGYLRSKEDLQTIVINFRCGEEYGSQESEQALLEEMQPHRDVKVLKLKGYHGETIPRWPGRGDNSASFDFPNLVTLKIKDCSELLYLPWQIGKLRYLKTLHISGLPNMEYVADSETLVSDEGSSFFPSLDNLSIHKLPKLKGWWRRSKSGSHMVNSNDSRSSREAQVAWVSSPCFPLLKNLTIKLCENMMFVPLCPQLEHLTIRDRRRDMRCAPRPLSCTKLKTLEINNLEWLKSMPSEYTQFPPEIQIVDDKRMERLGEVNEFPTYLLSSVRTLRIKLCPELVSIRGWLEHLSALEYLGISDCPRVELGGMSWHNLAATLQSLVLIGLEEMEELPEGLQYCTSLRVLSIYQCPKLKYMPKWMPKLTSLQELYIVWCSKSLKERCQKPNGEDWPLIQHISKLIR